MSYRDYVNVFQGNEEINLPKPQGIAGTWFFLKGQAGNTNPHAVLPFGMMSCGAYSGAYPSGYGRNSLNSCGGINKLYDTNKIKGFSHIHHSGTGGIKMYYNYAVTTPLYGELRPVCEDIDEEFAQPGYYTAVYKESGIKAEATVSDFTAFHRYTFSSKGTVMIDFSNNGLDRNIGEMVYSFSERSELNRVSDNIITAELVMNGLNMFIAAECDGGGARLWYDYKISDKKHIEKTDKRFGGVFEAEGTVNVKIAISFKSIETALSYLETDKPFDIVKKEASDKWERYLSAIEIEPYDESVKEIFYSNLYHSLIKPMNMKNESFIYGDGDFFCDFTTLWDIYKTQLPLVFTLFESETKGIIKTFEKTSNSLGFLPNTLILSGNFNLENEQARMLPIYIMADAYYRHPGLDLEKIIETGLRDLHSNVNKDFFENGKCLRATHTLDMAEGCFILGSLANDEELIKFSENRVNAFDKGTGLLTENSPYYEGDLWNYSFRLMNKMDERIALAGGKERFALLLDSFFGFGKEPVKQCHTPEDFEYVDTRNYHRFEGFNNEPDMETPYTYIFAGRHDRTCEVVRAGMNYMYTTGRGGIPGNNDSGALSSCYIWNALGIFPVSGQNLILIGSPLISSAKIHLAGGRSFELKVYHNSDKNIYVKEAVLNGKKLDKMMFTAAEMMNGGTLEIYMGER